MKHRFIAFSFFVLGILLFFVSKDPFSLPSEDTNVQISFYNKMKVFNDFEFIGIFIYNITVGFLLSILGFFTGGLLTALILIWNGFLIAMVYNIAIYKLPIDTILYASKHIPFEIFAFLIFAQFGLKGKSFISNILKKNEIDFSLIPKIKNLSYPTFLLIIAAILETI